MMRYSGMVRKKYLVPETKVNLTYALVSGIDSGFLDDSKLDNSVKPKHFKFNTQDNNLVCTMFGNKLFTLSVCATFGNSLGYDLELTRECSDVIKELDVSSMIAGIDELGNVYSVKPGTIKV